MNAQRLSALISTLLLGCANPGILESEPTSLDWGEIDFHNDDCMDCTCPDGCGPTQVLLTNTGETQLDIRMPNGFDADHLCLDGFTSSPNLLIGTLQSGEFFLLDVSVCGYLAGELNLPDENPARTVEGQLRFQTNGEPSVFEIPFSFVPVRNQD